MKQYYTLSPRWTGKGSGREGFPADSHPKLWKETTTIAGNIPIQRMFNWALYEEVLRVRTELGMFTYRNRTS